MKLALLGNDEILLQLARAAAGAAHEVVCVCEVGDWAGDVLQLFPSATLRDDWETLLLGEGFDVVVVGRPESLDSPLRAEQLRRLVQEGVPTMVVHPAADAILLHELAMIQSDTHSPLAAWNPVTHRANVRDLLVRATAVDDGFSELKQVTLQRTLPSGVKPAVFAQLACDAELLEMLAGPLDRVTALAPQNDGNSLSTLAVTFAGDRPILTQWNMQTGKDAPAGKLMVDGSNEQAELKLNGSDAVETGSELLAALEDFLTAKSPPARWNRTCHALELAEAVSESLRRGRTIQLHQQVHSEQQTFKSIMAAGGCLLLLGVLFMLGVVMFLDTIASPLRSYSWWRMWPLVLLAPVVLFLLLQVLWRVFPMQE